MKHTISTRWLANPNQGHTRFFINFGDCMNTLFVVKVNIHMLINGHVDTSLMLSIDPKATTWFERAIQSLSNMCD